MLSKYIYWQPQHGPHQIDSEEKRTWVEPVLFARSLEQLKVKCKDASGSTLRLVACEDTLVKDEG